ncbi:MAG: penicillin acylase family protein [Chloroflexi bacterium]|nr:penicillin acylase family protein [Chloroflexota bacterium]
MRARQASARRLAALARRAAGTAALIAGGRAHPVVDGRVSVAGCAALVAIDRDRFGVLHVWAESEADACFGQGFVHAQDRLFQMDSLRMAALGGTTEWVGARALDGDRFVRRLGLAGVAGRDYAHTAPDDRALLAAYAAGVNGGMRSLRVLPPEYAMLGAQPEPWHAEHSLTVGRLMQCVFTANWDTELLREQLLHAVGPERAAAVDPICPDGAHTATGAPYAPAAARVLAAYRAAVEAGVPAGAASNAWAVTAERSVTSAPLLASDPHMATRFSGLLHVSHVRGGTLDVIGATISGVPLVLMGHNGRVAWGMTAGLADAADCYIETLDPDAPQRYRTPEGWATGTTRIERFAVRDGASVEEHVLETRHGPVIGPALPAERRAIALRSSALAPGDTFGPVAALCRAPNPAAFDAAAARMCGAPFNYVYAGRDGAIGYRLAGAVPERAHGGGLRPADGATAPDPPPAALSAERMPHARHAAGPAPLVPANQAPGGDAQLGEDWCERWRAERIEVLLAASERHSVASFVAMQLDAYSEPLHHLVRLLLARELVTEYAVRDLLAAWDGHLRTTSPAAAIVESVLGEAARALIARVAGESARTPLGAGLGVAFAGSSFSMRLQGWVLHALEAAESPWCAGIDDRDRVLRAAAERALAQLRHALGPAPQRWCWGDLHRWSPPHPLGAVPLLGRLVARGPFPGDGNTLLQGSFSLLQGPSSVAVMPCYRHVIDLGDPDRSLFQLPTGNSGIPGHPRYDDAIEEFLGSRHRPLLYTRAAVEARRQHLLWLDPA